MFFSAENVGYFAALEDRFSPEVAHALTDAVRHRSHAFGPLSLEDEKTNYPKILGHLNKARELLENSPHLDSHVSTRRPNALRDIADVVEKYCKRAPAREQWRRSTIKPAIALVVAKTLRVHGLKLTNYASRDHGGESDFVFALKAIFGALELTNSDVSKLIPKALAALDKEAAQIADLRKLDAELNEGLKTKRAARGTSLGR